MEKKMIEVEESTHAEVMRIKYMLGAKTADEAMKKIIAGFYAEQLELSER